MCGIYGILAKNNRINIKDLILQALNLLKNRGYDSCGVYMDSQQEEIIKKFGLDDNPEQDIFDLLENSLVTYNECLRGIGHTRWATHGGKTNVNSHPHLSQSERYVIVHNGIVSNYMELKTTHLQGSQFRTSTDSEVIAYMIETLAQHHHNMIEVLGQLDHILEGTWACLIIDKHEKNRIYFMKNHNPMLIGENDNSIIFTSEPTGFLNSVDSYTLLREHCYGYFDTRGNKMIIGEHRELPLIKMVYNDLNKGPYTHWMRKEIEEQHILSVLTDPITEQKRYNQDTIILDLEWIKPTKYLYIIGCGSSYYAGLIASNYFRHTKAFEFVNVFDGAEFGIEHLESLENPEDDLLVVLISQSGETRDLNLATSICRDFTKMRNRTSEIKILGIINVVGSLISRRTIDNIYTNCGRENAVASTKSCTSQILACLLLSLYKAKLNNKLERKIEAKFINDLKTLDMCIQEVLLLEKRITQVAESIIKSGHKDMFILGRDELHGVALEGALKIKEVAYMHAEGFHMASLKHGPYALIHDRIPVILLYKEYNHFIKSVVGELKTRNAMVILISPNIPDDNEMLTIKIPENKSFDGLLSVVVLQLLSYHLSILQSINPDMPRNLAKVVTVD